MGPPRYSLSLADNTALLARGGALPISLAVGPAALNALALAACTRHARRGDGVDAKGKRHDESDELL